MTNRDPNEYPWRQPDWIDAVIAAALFAVFVVITRGVTR